MLVSMSNIPLLFLISLTITRTNSFQLPIKYGTKRYCIHTSSLYAQKSQHRREFLQGILATTILTSSLTLPSPPPAAAYEKSYPVDLDFENDDTSQNIENIRKDRIQKKKEYKKKSYEDATSSQILPSSDIDILGTLTWSGALWLLSGSRSNPLVTPVGNLLYDAETEPWLKDRNDGLFAPVPFDLLVILGAIFFFIGAVTDRAILLIGEGDGNASLQLAGVSLIAGGALELGRIAGGDKDPTRDDYERDCLLREEFATFAEDRMLKGRGNCHKSEVVSAFRRYYAKYRDAEGEFPLSDLEIERLTKEWNRLQGGQSMSSAGFFTGVQINKNADVFVDRSL